MPTRTLPDTSMSRPSASHPGSTVGDVENVEAAPLAAQGVGLQAAPPANQGLARRSCARARRRLDEQILGIKANRPVVAAKLRDERLADRRLALAAAAVELVVDG